MIFWILVSIVVVVAVVTAMVLSADDIDLRHPD